MVGAGVRHLMGAIGDGSQLVQPPNLIEHPEWEQVFIQSKDLDRALSKPFQGKSIASQFKILIL